MLVGGVGVAVLPGLRAARLNANESAAIGALKNISSGQAQCQASGLLDVDGNGAGEYGFFGELSGRVALRGGRAKLDPPVLSNRFGEVVASQVRTGGYVFQMFLPDRAEQGVAEDPTGGDAGNDNGVHPGAAETLWCCYAWPQDRGSSGIRTFFINQSGDVLATNGSVVAYDGSRRPCTFEVAFEGSAPLAMGSHIAANTVGRDGNTWVVV